MKFSKLCRRVVSSALLMSAIGFSQHALAIYVFSDVYYSTHSITFTIDGDMTGYSEPAEDPGSILDTDRYFSMILTGDIWDGPDSVLGTEVTWTDQIFDNEESRSDSYVYNGSVFDPYIWRIHQNSLADSVATSRTITAVWSDDYQWLDPDAVDPLITFAWGRGDSEDLYTVLAEYRPYEPPSDDSGAGEGPDAGSGSGSGTVEVSSPSTTALFAFAFAGLVYVRRKNRN